MQGHGEIDINQSSNNAIAEQSCIDMVLSYEDEVYHEEEDVVAHNLLCHL
jgi:hypothetical protein